MTTPKTPNDGSGAYQPGQLARVYREPGGFPLPPGLKDGDEVKLIEFNGRGYWTVEFRGNEILVFMANLGPWPKAG